MSSFTIDKLCWGNFDIKFKTILARNSDYEPVLSNLNQPICYGDLVSFITTSFNEITIRSDDVIIFEKGNTKPKWYSPELNNVELVEQRYYNHYIDKNRDLISVFTDKSYYKFVKMYDDVSDDE